MQNLFENQRPNPDNIRKIKEFIYNYFEWSENTMITVAELRCHEPNCPPTETVISARHLHGSIEVWRISKTVNDISLEEIENLLENKAKK